MLLRAVDRAWVKVADELLMATISAVGRREEGVEAATWRTFVEISSLTCRRRTTLRQTPAHSPHIVLAIAITHSHGP